MPLFSNVQVIMGGQSQCAMFLNSGGETSEPALSSAPPAGTRLTNRLNTLMPGVSVTVSGAAGGQASPPASYTYIAGSPLMIFNESTGGNRWWNAYNQTPGNAYEPLRLWITGRGGAGRLGVYVHYCNTQDTGDPLFNNTVYRNSIKAFYERVYADCASSFGLFVIQPVVNGSRSSGANNLSWARRVFRAVSGQEPLEGFAPLPYVLPALTATAWNAVDGAHPYRSTAYRIAETLAHRVAGVNGVATSMPDAPVVYRAVQVGPTTVRAFISSPGGHPIRIIGGLGSSAWFSISGGGTATGIGAVDNSQVATLRRATVDVTFSGALTALSRLAWAAGARESSYSVTNEPPVGTLRNLLYSDPTGNLTTITEACEDVVTVTGVVHGNVVENGVPIEQ
jgi:hypothetical protein